MSERPPESVPPADRGTGGETRALHPAPAGGPGAPAPNGLTDTTKLPRVTGEQNGDERGTVHGELNESMDGFRATGYPQPAWSQTPPPGGATAVGGYRPYQGHQAQQHGQQQHGQQQHGQQQHGQQQHGQQQHGQQQHGQQHGQPHGQQQGQTQPVAKRPNRPNRPSRPVAGTKAAEDRTRARVFKGLGLLAISIVSGLLWYAIRSGGEPQDNSGPGPIETAVGKYDFTRAHDPVRDDTCSPHAYGRIQVLLRKFPCQGMTRTLYTSTPEAGRTVVSSVSVVHMPSVRAARLLKLRTTQDGTGNVDDLPKDGISVPGAPKTLNEGGFAAKVHGMAVVIVESDFLTADRSGDHAADIRLLDSVSKDAVRLGRS